MTEYQFINEINGLLYKKNITLYALIENIFIKMIPMFESLLNIKLLNNDKYKQLSVIIKMQDYQFENENEVRGGWHTEGDLNDHIIAGGLYYFDVTSCDGLQFVTNVLEIAEEEVSKKAVDNIAKVNINHNDCVVFRNSEKIQHRAIIETEETANKTTNKVSRKMLGFFLMDPDDEDVANHNGNYFKWINFPWKMDVFIKYFINFDMNMYDKISEDLIVLLKIFTFGDEKYIRRQLTDLEENVKLFKERIDFGTDENPFYSISLQF